ncbi:MAG: hypothetical protein R3B68_00610 [Phycisphaerales bacterium]
MPNHRLVAIASVSLVALSGGGSPALGVGGDAASLVSGVAGVADQIESLFGRMERAVMAGDQDAYVALIDHTDPVFVQEQINWAKDLERGVPAAFDMVLVSEPQEWVGPDGRESIRADIEMRYTPGDWIGEGGPYEARTIRYRAWFTPLHSEDASLSAAIPGAMADAEGRPWMLYAGEAWEVLEHGTTRVMYSPNWRELASLVVEALPPIRAHVDAQMQSDNSEHVQAVKIYGDMQHLQASIYLSYVAGLSGWNEPGESIKITGRRTGGPRSMDGLLAHEYGHAATFWLGAEANNMPWWTLEGVADFVSRAYRADYDEADADPARARAMPESVDRQIRAWGQQGRLPAWGELADFYNFDPRFSANVYRQGEHMIAYITEHFGVSERNEWLRAMATGASIDEATADVLGLSFEDLDAQWRAAVMPEATEADGDGDADAPRSGRGG